ncbi:MAG TPA: HlyD family efflux transporter periplasmic adaptor subunit, partial [Gemmatimonadales bacterium]|nr:HlyD family efflux transporter periplasmic adaptor subunit [Gemmatimonadales bacterium]
AFYCNVNDAWTFPERRARLWVTAAGSWIQLVLASLAAIVWWAATPGTVASQIAFAAVLIGGITTVFMNANPLIPLDGYYALSDYLEIPNLRQRAFAHLAWWVRRRVFRLDVPAPPADPRERRIFLVYGALAGAYIGLILTFFAATSLGWLTRWLGVVGLLLFVVGLGVMLRRPAREWVGTARMALRRFRATLQFRSWRGRLAAASPVVVVLGALVPWPITVTARFSTGPQLAIPHVAPDSGIIQRVQVLEGARVTAGAQLLQIRNIELERELAASRRISDSLAARIALARGHDRLADVAVMTAERAGEEARLRGLRERAEALRIRALGTGLVISHRPEDLRGQWVSSGETVLVLGRLDSLEVRISLGGAGGTLVRPGAQVSLLPDATRKPVRARVAAVSAVAQSPQSIEARLHIPAASTWRPGMTGRASIKLRSSNLWGALWWSVRRGIRSDILL